MSLLRVFALIGAVYVGCEGRVAANEAEIVVASYNVQNYTVENREGSAKPKSERSIAAVIQVLGEIRPDIVGIAEMGSQDDFEDFKSRLKAAGLDYIDSEYVQASDTDRRLALLSRFPIISRQSIADLSYDLDGLPEKVQRGILDVTIRINPKYDLRLMGVHLKSKRPVPQGEALMRRFEAQLLRKHVESVLDAGPEVNLLVFGDFNDTKNEPPIQEVMGVRGSATCLADLPAEDEDGDRWTYYWRSADQYSRIDYLFASRALLPEIVKSKSRVHRSSIWSEASDHRAIYTAIIPADRKRR